MILFGGEPDTATRSLWQGEGVTYGGRLARRELPDALGQARWGLGWAPDIYPHSLHTSTKTLEYVAAGLGVISNRFAWMCEFARERDIRPLWLDELTVDAVRGEVPTADRLPDLEWSAVLDRAQFARFVGAAR